MNHQTPSRTTTQTLHCWSNRFLFKKWSSLRKVDRFFHDHNSVSGVASTLAECWWATWASTHAWNMALWVTWWMSPRTGSTVPHHGLVCLKIGVPNRWMVYFMEIPKGKWMIPEGSPILWNLHIRVYLKPGWFVGCNHKVMICCVNGPNRRSQGFVNLRPTLQNNILKL